ncbi:uncharacterized protein THITE_122778 [Thermothielavioides terrestris NRRL 8126]|uniref:Uncharacterized protein n=1 Tax=Thermothielavioides terrestris (strain ATCC 38088 / NRRL 8126) TaxID=578455 RepID=G2RFC1_THETT|nr:uncharacterized protein THITE_122778 [Thermothielavioides terrestris NRRL 8126]AEO70404.1 hypothetical protein THITE_122778 [Thermothielavioides terrestris NRRL 8126]
MTPPASQCRRALQRQITPVRDAVWITDGVLASAFHRYWCVSRTWRRSGSNVPGPLESQRRLGRRRMGVAGMWYCPPTPPSWAFPVPLNLTQWTWSPPSPNRVVAHSLPPPTDPMAVQLTSVLRGLWRRPAPQEAADEPPAAFADDAVPHFSSPPIPPTSTARSFAVDMDTFRWAATHADDATLALNTKKICRKLRQLIALGDVSPEHVLSLSAEIWAALDERLKGLLVRAVTVMPAAHRTLVSEPILSILGRIFSAWSRPQRRPDNATITQLLELDLFAKPGNIQKQLGTLPSHLRQARAISRALEILSSGGRDDFLLAAHRLALSTEAALPKGRCALRYSWLYALAHMPGVGQDFLFGAVTAFSAPSLQVVRPLSHVELCSLLWTQWASQGYLDSSKRATYARYQRWSRDREQQHMREAAVLGSLFLALPVGKSNRLGNVLHHSAWELLTRLKRKDEVMQSLECIAQTTELPVHILEKLASTSGDHNIAVQLRDLWMRSSKPQDGRRTWNPKVFEQYVDDIVMDPNMPPKTIWRVLDVNRFETRLGSRSLAWKMRRHRGTFGACRAAIAEKAIKAFSRAHHLSKRSAFRHVSQAYFFIREVRGSVPQSVILALYRLVTRDLWEEKPGVTKRLLWFLSVVEKHHGLEVAWSCRLALRRWRAKLQWDAASHKMSENKKICQTVSSHAERRRELAGPNALSN